ncbi:hypothetical protein EDC62_0399 [Tibeticola sediminis]|uniref:Uncharacterized protein n=1 Tax=Tibeticola sediminis TaxID=1917811 RepID=A0A3N4V6H1_9BURK|nr:hypothetical protein EDC62_0399 [Tibeticola sediminis]
MPEQADGLLERALHFHLGLRALGNAEKAPRGNLFSVAFGLQRFLAPAVAVLAAVAVVEATASMLA